MENKVKEVMAAVFEVDIISIGDLSSPDTIENWDSMRHMHLVAALEEEFNIKFSDEQIGDLLNYKLICLTLKEVIN